MSWVDEPGVSQRRQHGGKPQLARGEVIQVDSDGTIWVQLAGWSRDHAYDVPSTNWMHRPNPSLDPVGGAGPPLVPRVGSQCLVVFDHLGDAWVPVWGG